MINKIQIENKELLILFEFEDSTYGKISVCIDENDRKVFVTNNKIITENKIINEINNKYNLELPNQIKGIIF